MHSTPRGQKQPRIKSFVDLDLPEVIYGAHLINSLRLFNEVTYLEINNCPSTKGLPDWEKEAIVMISNKYKAMLSKATDPACMAPHQTVDAANTNVDAQFAAMRLNMPRNNR